MGFYNTNYFGAYLAVKNQKTVVQVKVRKCVECDSNESESEHVFCPKCGAKIHEDTVNKETEFFFSHYDYDEWCDELRSPEYPNSDEETYFFPNTSSSDAQINLGLDDEAGFCDINDTISPGVYISEFEQEFAGLLTEVEKEGFEYEIRFGFVRMAS
jgi:hypothetical protein